MTRRLLLPALLLPLLCQAQEVGQQVLARWDVRGDRHVAPATVEAVDGRWVDLLYASGEHQRVCRAALVLRPLKAGDLVEDDEGPARVEALLEHGRLRLTLLDGDRSLVRPLGAARALLRTDHGVGPRWPGVQVAPGDRVLAKWDRYSWYLGQVTAVQGEALHVRYDDGSERWTPADLVLPAARLPAQVFAINPRDGQGILASVLKREERRFSLRYFDGTRGQAPSSRVGVYLDQPGLEDEDDPCSGLEGEDPRPQARVLSSWLTQRLHDYSPDLTGDVGTTPAHLEIVLALFEPGDRKPPPAWKQVCAGLAGQLRAFLKRELGAWSQVEVRALDAPVQGEHDLAWYAGNLRDDASWHDWAPTRDCLRVAFPHGPRDGRHRVLVVLPDMPGQSADDSGVEGQLGFVRLGGDWIGHISPAGLKAAPPEHPAFSDWKPDFLATTMAHEVLHTLGLPHTDGDPWSVMNLGPWYPITDPRVHLAQLHKLVLRSPFLGSLSLSQGLALYLLDRRSDYLRVIAATPHLDARYAVLYGEGPGLYRLRPLLTSFGPGTACREGRREDGGERVICRAYLASLVQFLLERKGTDALRSLRHVRDAELAGALAAQLDTTVEQLERDWQAWLADQLPE